MSRDLDDTLRALARVDAPADLSRRVRARLDAANPAAPIWPRLAAVAAAVLVAAGLWVAVSIDRGKGGDVAQVVEAPPAQRVRESGPRAGADATSVRPDGTSVRPDETSVRAGGTSVPPLIDTVSRRAGGASAPPPSDPLPLPDHDRALPALAQIETIGPASLVSRQVTVAAREVTALGAIAPIEIPALGADQGERR